MSIEAMKQALEALDKTYWSDGVLCSKAFNALRQAIEQAEQQDPVAWIHRIIKDGELLATHVTQKPPEQYEKWWTSYPLYAAPPKREWVGLIVDDIPSLWGYAEGDIWLFAQAIEAKLKEKNT